MSLRITRTGLLDTVQDGGRHGCAHLGIGPGGAMDPYSAALANTLLGREPADAVLELHFPAAQIVFEKATVIALTGADFAPNIDGRPVPMDHPVAVPAGAHLRFEQQIGGARAYLSVIGGLAIMPWLGSYSTHLKAAAGGVEGRALRVNDVIRYREDDHLPNITDVTVLPWKALHVVDDRKDIAFLMGPEWSWMSEKSRQAFEAGQFRITTAADRMGYRLYGPELQAVRTEQLVSSGVCAGTIQLLPDGQLILLMADHQTTGGYPRIAQVISAHLPLLAQKKPGDNIHLKLTQLATAQEKIVAQKKYLQQLQIACKLKIDEWRSLPSRP